MPFTKAHLYVCSSVGYGFGIRVHDICCLFLIHVFRKSLCLIVYMLYTKIHYSKFTLNIHVCHFRFFFFLYFGPVALYMLNKTLSLNLWTPSQLFAFYKIAHAAVIGFFIASSLILLCFPIYVVIGMFNSFVKDNLNAMIFCIYRI